MFADEQVTSLSTGGNTLWGLGDHLGSLRDIADLNEGTGVTSITNHRTYNVFGKLTAETNSSVDLVFGYTGKQFDEATGLQHNLYRWYDSAVGQWMSEDPTSFAAGDANLNRYVGNRATNATDPFGLESSDIDTQSKWLTYTVMNSATGTPYNVTVPNPNYREPVPSFLGEVFIPTGSIGPLDRPPGPRELEPWEQSLTNADDLIKWAVFLGGIKEWWWSEATSQGTEPR